MSILILTLNEEKNLPACLKSVAWSDDVTVLDSYSTDRTVEIAREFGARVVQRKFHNYGAHRESARSEIKYKHTWVFALDADERPEPELVKELQSIARDPSVSHAAYRMRRKDHFMGRWIKQSTLYPSWFLRLYRPDRIRYEPRSVHEYPVVDGTVGALRGHLAHYSFNKGLSEWLAKHNRYSELEARENLANISHSNVDWLGLLGGSDPLRRRRALKELSFRLPLRPSLRFMYMYVYRRGFLDGWPGFTYCRLLAIYEYMIVLKMKEIERREKGLPV